MGGVQMKELLSEVKVILGLFVFVFVASFFIGFSFYIGMYLAHKIFGI
jgi:hypothetical protein